MVVCVCVCQAIQDTVGCGTLYLLLLQTIQQYSTGDVLQEIKRSFS